MEVHHHPDLHHKKKNLKEFFLEFVMIFLAVTLGFIAENIRQTISNHQLEKHYVQSLINDLKDDTASMNLAIHYNIIKTDTLQKLIQLSQEDLSVISNRIKLYKYSPWIGLYSLFKSNDATMMQLKTSGLQLIKKDDVADSIANYDVKIKVLSAAETIYLSATDNGLLSAQQLLDYSILLDTSYYSNDEFKNKFLPIYEDSKSSLPRFFNKINYEIGATDNYINNINRVLPYTERLIAYLKKEYAIQ